MAVATCVSFDKEIREYLDTLAKEQKRSLAFVTNQLVAEAIEARNKAKNKKQ
jgi:predicted transcriptional regulator